MDVEIPASTQHGADLKEAFVEWCSMPDEKRHPRFLTDWAKEHGVPERTAREWKKTTWFRDSLELRYAQLNVDPDRLQRVADAMWQQACNGNTKAAELYWRFVERIKPPRVIIEDRRVEELTDDELRTMLTEAAEGLTEDGT